MERWAIATMIGLGLVLAAVVQLPLAYYGEPRAVWLICDVMDLHEACPSDRID